MQRRGSGGNPWLHLTCLPTSIC
uniref:Uncharacterized protein n=1 Tax=Anguilla anguilla TaxID=7936 RepID=A0A0E9UGH2_ANGAN